MRGVRVVQMTVEEALAALPPGAGPIERLEAAVRGHFLSSLEHSDYPSASIRAFAFLPANVREGCRPARRDYERIWRDIVAEAARASLLPADASEDSVRLLLLGAVHWAGGMVSAEWTFEHRQDRIGFCQQRLFRSSPARATTGGARESASPRDCAAGSRGPDTDVGA